MTTLTHTIRNGVDTQQMYGTLDAIKAQPELGRFEFRARNHWIAGAHNRTTIQGLLRRRPGGRLPRGAVRDRRGRAGDPARDRHRRQSRRVSPARARRLPDDLDRLRRGGAQGQADLRRVDARGRDGRARRARPVSDEVRNGFERIRVAFRVSGEASEEKLREVVERAQARSAVFDMVTNGVPVEVTVGVIELAATYRSGRAAGRARRGAGARAGRPRGAARPRRQLSRSRRSTALKAAGYFAAPVPVALGGLGVVVRARPGGRLEPAGARRRVGGDRREHAHLVAVLNMERRRDAAAAEGNERRARAFAASLEQIVRDGVVLAAAISERGQDLTRPGTTPRAPRSGWRIDGRKWFCTMSPAATAPLRRRHVRRRGALRLRHRAHRRSRRDDQRRLGRARHARVRQQLGHVRRRRAARAGAARRLRGRRPAAYMDRNLVAGLFHASASLGIAESAEHAVARRRVGDDARARMLVADNAIDLAAARAALSRAATPLDRRRRGRRRGAVRRDPRLPRRSSTTPQGGWWTARWRCRAEPAT